MPQDYINSLLNKLDQLSILVKEIVFGLRKIEEYPNLYELSRHNENVELCRKTIGLIEEDLLQLDLSFDSIHQLSKVFGALENTCNRFIDIQNSKVLQTFNEFKSILLGFIEVKEKLDSCIQLVLIEPTIKELLAVKLPNNVLIMNSAILANKSRSRIKNNLNKGGHTTMVDQIIISALTTAAGIYGEEIKSFFKTIFQKSNTNIEEKTIEIFASPEKISKISKKEIQDKRFNKIIQSLKHVNIYDELFSWSPFKDRQQEIENQADILVKLLKDLYIQSIFDNNTLLKINEQVSSLEESLIELKNSQDRFEILDTEAENERLRKSRQRVLKGLNAAKKFLIELYAKFY